MFRYDVWYDIDCANEMRFEKLKAQRRNLPIFIVKELSHPQGSRSIGWDESRLDCVKLANSLF